MRNNYKLQHGLTLIELMIALTISMGLSIAVLFFYAGQMRTFSQVARKNQTSQEARNAFEILSNLVRQADICISPDLSRCPTALTIATTYSNTANNPNAATTLALANDDVRIDFVVPSGYDIWPNSTPPFTDNAIRIQWSTTDHIVYVSAGTSVNDPLTGVRTLIPLAGASGNMNTKIVNLDLWPQVTSAAGVTSNATTVNAKPTGGYRLALTARVGVADATYTNTLDSNGPLQHYRTVTYQRTIIPRNW